MSVRRAASGFRALEPFEILQSIEILNLQAIVANGSSKRAPPTGRTKPQILISRNLYLNIEISLHCAVGAEHCCVNS